VETAGDAFEGEAAVDPSNPIVNKNAHVPATLRIAI
jgi:hypothetical protein